MTCSGTPTWRPFLNTYIRCHSVTLGLKVAMIPSLWALASIICPWGVYGCTPAPVRTPPCTLRQLLPCSYAMYRVIRSMHGTFSCCATAFIASASVQRDCIVLTHRLSGGVEMEAQSRSGFQITTLVAYRL